ncbi:uncharacterized protein LOC142623853 [Castanea sativa]|uniref:uncharacterized protein LOC142623853 n=1 Tax=Castanea sativa TaxID=21020 RepID=UPI003F64EBB1
MLISRIYFALFCTKKKNPLFFRLFIYINLSSSSPPSLSLSRTHTMIITMEVLFTLLTLTIIVVSVIITWVNNDLRKLHDVTVKSVPKLEVEPKIRVGLVEKIDDNKNISETEVLVQEKLGIQESEGCDCESPKEDDSGREVVKIVEVGEKPVVGDKVFDESPRKEKLREIEFHKNGDDKLIDLEDDWEWEGIERTELEKVFGAAVAFVGSVDNADRVSSLGSNLKMQLYGLHKIATQGPCHEPQPMALKLSARAKWNAWQQLGNMSPEMAMELYISLLSGSIPGWMQDDFVGDHEHVLAEVEVYKKLASDLKTLLPNKPGAVDESNMEIKPCFEGLDVNAFGVQTT